MEHAQNVTELRHRPEPRNRRKDDPGPQNEAEPTEKGLVVTDEATKALVVTNGTGLNGGSPFDDSVSRIRHFPGT